VFRDGVSRFALKNVKANEIKGIRLAFEEIASKNGKKPKLIFILVNKKIDAKFFLEGNGHGGSFSKNRSGILNPNPGTVISDQVTKDDDFYLISIKTRQGTSTPTHYITVENDLMEDLKESGANDKQKNLLKENIELLCFKLCYMYYNWSAAIKVPAPICYA
jgi:aubergine-like protein